MTRQSQSAPRSRADGERVLATVGQAVEGFVRRRTDVDVEDVVQEAMTRLLENRLRLEPEAWGSYAVVSAGRLLRDRERAHAVQQRHVHRLHTPDLVPGPEEQVLSDEEHTALRRAMTHLDPEDVRLLNAHYGSPDRSHRSIAPATAARLARVRAKLRVAYVLEHGRLPLPTQRCRPVLEAVSTGDRRRQERIGAGRHLLACPACTSYAPALVERQRAIAALHPLGWLAVGAGAAWGALRRNPGRAAAGTTLAGAAMVGGALLLAPADPAPAPSPSQAAAAAPAPTVPSPAAAGLLTIAGDPALPLPAALPTGPAVADEVPVHEVATDEGFWIGTGPGQRVWVELAGPDESPVQVRAGDLVSFTGEAVGSEADYAERIGLRADQGSAELAELGVHLAVPQQALVVRTP